MYKNWKEINKLAAASPFMTIALATLSTDMDKPAVRAVIAAFPRCFNTEAEAGPVPLSVIIEETRAEMLEENPSRTIEEGRVYPCSYGVVQRHGIPFQEFWYGDSDFKDDEDMFPLPESIPTAVELGQIVEWKGMEFVVVENNDNYYTIRLAPAECILVDC